MKVDRADTRMAPVPADAHAHDRADGAAGHAQRRFVLASAAAILLFAAAYANSLRNAFHFDDSHVVVNNLHIRELANLPSFFLDARTFSTLETNAAYRPLVTATLAVDHFFAGGLDPVPFHVTQLLLLAAVGLGLFLLALHLFRLMASSRTAIWPRWAALAAATFFCLHTANTETGNYITARSESLSALGILGAFLLYIYVPASRRWQLFLIPVVVGTLAKVPAVMFAPMFLVYRLIVEDQITARDVFRSEAWPRVRRTLLSTAPAFVLGLALFVFVDAMQPAGVVYGGQGRLEYLITQTWIWVRYARLFILPTDLSADAGLPLLDSWMDLRVAAGLLLLGASLYVVNRATQNRKFRPIAFGILWFWFALVPTSSIFPFGQVTNDHRVFLPFIGLTIAAVGWLAVMFERLADAVPEWRTKLPAFATWFAILIIAAHAIGTHQRNLVWASSESLWADVTAKNPQNGRGLMNYGLTFMQRGEFEEARDLFLRAQPLLPNYSVLAVNLGIVHGALGDTTAAEAHFQRALALAPRAASSHTYYARWLTQVGRAPEALERLEQAVAVAAGDVFARHMLMNLLAAKGDTLRLREIATETLAIARTDPVASAHLRGDPSFSPAAVGWLGTGLNYTGRGQHVEAAQAYRKTVAMDSTQADAWNNLGYALLKLGFYGEAVPALEAALRHRPDHIRAASNLRWARSEVAAH